MATVEIIKPRLQEGHFGLYRTSVGGDESIIVRRKVGEPTDYMHSKSMKSARQRYFMTLASQHYARLSPSQKALSRHQFEIVEYETGHSRTEEKLLMGRELFISREIHSLKTTGKQLILPLEVCIVLTDKNLVPLEGQLRLLYKTNGDWEQTPGELLHASDWLFSLVPPDKSSYNPIGEAVGYYDPGVFLTLSELKSYHYHKLFPEGEDLESWASQWPTLWGGTGGRWYRFWHRFYDPEPYAAMVVHSEITLTNYTGGLRIGLGYDNGRYAPTELYASAYYNVSSTSPQPIHIWMLLPAPFKLPDHSYCLCCYQDIPNTEYWLWYSTVYRCGEPYPY
ncbi:hypothetical protein ES707_22034 [subsurface metagenome]